MSLINLLAVGATLKGARDKSGSYKLDSIGALPTFGTPKTAAPSPAPAPAPEAETSCAGSAPPEAAVIAKEIIQPISEVTPLPQGSLFPLAAVDAALPTHNANLAPEGVPEMKETPFQASRSPYFPGVGSEGTTGSPANALSVPGPAPVQDTAQQSINSDPPSASPVPLAAAPPAKTAQTQSWIKRLVNHILFGRPVPGSPAATVQTELALEKITVVRNDLRDESEAGRRRSRKKKSNVFSESHEAPRRPVPWFNLAAHFGKKPAPPATALTPGTADGVRIEPVPMASDAQPTLADRL